MYGGDFNVTESVTNNHCINGDCLSQWRMPNSTPVESKQIGKKFLTVDYVWGTMPGAKFHGNRFTWANGLNITKNFLSTYIHHAPEMKEATLIFDMTC